MKIGFDDLRMAVWFLRRPDLYPVLARKIKKRLFDHPHPDTRAEAERWCARRAVDTDTALAQMTGAAPQIPLRQRFADTFEQAQARVDACPEAMGGPGNIGLLYDIAEHLQATRVVETGVAYGWSALALLLSLDKRPNARLFSTDMPRVLSEADPHTGCAVPEELRHRWTILRRADREALPHAINALGQLDLCHYDSDKTYEGRAWAYPILWRALRPGGIFVSDDVGDNVAFRDFAQRLGVEPLVVHTVTPINEQYVGILQK